MVGNRFNIESAPGFVNVLSWTKSFRLAQCGKQPLPGATIGVLSVFLVRMMNSRIGFDWRDLEVFVAAAESGSIARAAERCRLAPSAASKRLSDLEAALGAPLLERHNRGVRPTWLFDHQLHAAGRPIRPPYCFGTKNPAPVGRRARWRAPSGS